jgi:hypothetical protein
MGLSTFAHGHKAGIRGRTPKRQGAGCWVLGYTQAPTATAMLLRPALRFSVAAMLVCLCCWFAFQHASSWVCWHAGVHANSTDRPAPFAPSLALAINQHASMPATGMLACLKTSSAQTDQRPWPPSLAGWPSTSMPACQQRGCWHAGVQASSTDRPAFLAPSWSAGRWPASKGGRQEC